MGDKVLIEVSDNGIGIDEQNLPRVFERFFRTDASRARSVGGSGLGLAIVKHIVEAHGQTIHVRSTLGVGTTFVFTLDRYLR
jgi:two-component system phosphate regulon sensor histidine kinase PhoR